MPTIRLYPRLTPGTAYSIWIDNSEKSVNELKSDALCKHQSQHYASTGGSRVSQDALEKLAAHIRLVASKHGYPNSSSRKKLADFDVELGIWLYENLDIIPGEALRYDTWAFLSLCVVPDIVKWRFTNYHESRSLGGRRNCLQRLWLRTRAFDLGARAKNRFVLLRNLTEDAFVSVMERPSLSGNSQICRSIGIAWTKHAKDKGRSRMESLNRAAIVSLRAKLTLYQLDVLEPRVLNKLVQECYTKVESIN